MKPVLHPRSSQDPERITLGVCTLAGILLLLWLNFTPRITPKGVWHRLTNLPCPFCGGTRGITTLLLDTDPLRAFLYNPLVTLGAFSAVLILLYLVIVVFLDLPRLRFTSVSPKDARFLRIAFLLALAANWGYLLLTRP